MSGFSRSPGSRGRDAGRYIARFTGQEASVLRDLAGQVAELVSGTADDGDPEGTGGMADELGITEETEAPEDPVLARLLPDAYREDPQSAGEFRRYTERDLRDGKTEAARTVLETLPERGGRVTLNDDQAQTWLRALNDIRLALGVRLEVTEEVHEELARMDPEDPRYGPLTVYDWLTAVQESLVVALS
jgi:hypothetical protein